MHPNSCRRSAALLVAIVFIVLATPMRVHPCPLCVNLTNFALSHPRSLEIALATRWSIEKGLIRNETELISTKTVCGDGNGFIALRKIPARQLVDAWTKRQTFADCPR